VPQGVDRRQTRAFRDGQKTAVKLPLPNGGVYFREITRAEYERWIRPIVDRTMAPVRQALADAKLTPAESRKLCWSAGSTRVLSCGVRSKNSLDALRTRSSTREVVALGAACRLTSSKAA